MSQAHDPHGVDRRGFLKLVGAAGLASTLSPVAAALAQSSTPAAAPAAPATPAKPEGPSEEALALVGILRKRYGGRLTDAQWADVASGVDNGLAGGKRLHASALANGDEPDFTFRA